MRRLLPAAFLALAGCSSAPEPAPSVSRGADANARWRDGKIAEAAAVYGDALAEDRFSVDVPATVRHLNNLGVLAMYEGKLEVAERDFLEALDLCAIDGTEADRARLRLQLACVRLRRADRAEDPARDLDLAAGDLAAAAAWAEDEGGADLAHHSALEAGLLLRRGDAAGAAKAARRARAEADLPEERAAAALLLGRALEGDRPSARAAYQEGLDGAREAGHLPIAVECLLGLSRTWEGEDAAAARRYARLAWDAAAARGWIDGRNRAEAVLKRLGD
ncbi:MAG: hypothetical protein HYY18_07010 [Planctomycetes bacterium]|nr:hypothetical protein [Planctomycetota bacterium]